MPMGMPQRHEFKEEEVTFIWPGEKDLEKRPEPDAWVEEDDPELPRVVIRSSSDTMLRKHTAIVTKGGLSWDWRSERISVSEGFFFSSITDRDSSSS